MKPTNCPTTRYIQKPRFYTKNTHTLLQNGSNSKHSTKDSQELRRTVKAISEIKDHKPESKNKTDSSNRNLKTMKNILTVLSFCRWNQRTVKISEA